MISDRVEELAGGPTWPPTPLWVVAVRLRDGARIVFGRDDVGAGVRLGAAVAASSSIPGFFAPVEIAGDRYVDGGVHSPTNADLVRDSGFDLVVVSAPMAGSWRSMRAHPTALARTGARVALDREVAALRRSGTEVLVFQPGPSDTPVMDGRSMDPASRQPVATRARESALETLRRPDLEARVSPLRKARR
jgi:NTE family protein